MGNSNDITGRIPRINFALILILLHACSQDILERSIYCHKSCTCLGRWKLVHSPPQVQENHPFCGLKVENPAAQFCQSHFPSQKPAPFLNHLSHLLVSPCISFPVVLSTGVELPQLVLCCQVGNTDFILTFLSLITENAKAKYCPLLWLCPG